jgi:hypothetical protein
MSARAANLTAHCDMAANWPARRSVLGERAAI